MKNLSALRRAEHLSYERHRRQMWVQILLPIILAALIFVGITALTVRAAFVTGGDTARWGAIATIWLTLPALLAALIALVILGAVIWMVGRLTSLIPGYSYQVQRFFFKVEYGTKRAATMVRRPVLFLKGALSALRSGLSGAIERLR